MCRVVSKKEKRILLFVTREIYIYICLIISMVIRRKIGMLRSRYVFLESRRSWKQGIVRASRRSVINRVAFSLWETEKGAGPAGERIENDGCGVFAGEDPVEGNVYRGEERAKSFGSALTHFLRGSVKRAHFATAKLISPFPPRDSLPFFPFSSSLFFSLFRQTQWPNERSKEHDEVKRYSPISVQTSTILAMIELLVSLPTLRFLSLLVLFY